MKQYSLNELTDSRLLYDKKPSRFIFLIIGLVVLLLGGIIVASLYINKPYIVKASGMVTSTQKTPLTINVSAEITALNITEGQAVQVGDIIMSFDDSQTRIQMEQYAKLVEYYIIQIAMNERCVNEINSSINTFSKDIPDEAFFFYQIEQLNNTLQQYTHTDKYYKDQGYTNKQIVTQQEQIALQREGAKYSVISDLNTKRISLEMERESAVAQRDTNRKLLNEYTVKATQTGIVHLSSNIASGMMLQSGTVVGSISSNIPEDLIVEAYVSGEDRLKININSKAIIAASGVSQNDYGVIEGTITSIDNDATINQEKGTVYYKIKIALDNTVLTNKSGQIINLTNGMMTQSNIQYMDSTWFVWACEQLGLKSVQ